MDRRKTWMSESVSSELYDLELVETTCLENGLSCNRICDSEIEVTIAPNMILVIANTENTVLTPFSGWRCAVALARAFGADDRGINIR